MMSVLESNCLKLNANWVAFDVTSVKQAFRDASAGAATLLRFHDGYPTPYRIEDWINLPVGDKEEFIGTSGKFHDIKKIAVPRVLININFDQIILKEQPPTIHNVAKRDNNICQLCGEPLTKEEMSLEHRRPRSKGGDNSWTNLYAAHKRCNSERSNVSYRKKGYKVPKFRAGPKPLHPASKIVNVCGYVEWDLFRIPRAS